MKFSRFLLLACICCNLSAATYHGITGNKDVSLTIESIPYKEFASMLNSLGKAGTLREHEIAPGISIGQFKRQHRAFLVTIKNDTAKTIHVGERLIHDIKNYHTHIAELIELYGPHVEAFKNMLSDTYVLLGIKGVMGIVLAALFGTSIVYHTKDKDMLFPIVFFGAFLALNTIFTIKRLRSALTLHRKRKATTTKIAYFKNFNRIITKDKSTPIPITEETYTIKPQETLVSLLLIDTERFPIHAFHKITPKLLYQNEGKI